MQLGLSLPNPNNKEPTIRTKSTGNYQIEVEVENDTRPINLANGDFQETHQVADNDPSTQTTNQIFEGLLNCDTYCVNPSCLIIPVWS